VKKPGISREQAVELATDVARTMERTFRVVRDLADLDLLGIRTPCVYGLDASNCWIAYLTLPGFGLRSSEIVVIDKTTGAVRYSGSANDEG
jgi:tRNA A-37 threonylcarbamoyl transferase component Bud32